MYDWDHLTDNATHHEVAVAKRRLRRVPRVGHTHGDHAVARPKTAFATATARHSHSHQRGVALVMVLLAVVVAVILALSFQSAQSTTIPIAQNINYHAAARSVAESAMAMTVAHVRSSDTWRDDFAAGNMPTNASLASGTFTLTAEDGQDLDGDGTISIPDEGDGDLTDDESDPVTLTIVATVGNATHKLKGVVAAFEDPGTRLRLLFVVGNSMAMTSDDKNRVKQFEDWNYEVALASASETQTQIEAKVEDADVVYISNSALATLLMTKLNNAAIGVVSETAGMATNWSMAGSIGSTSQTQLSIINNTHDITSPFAVGTIDAQLSAAGMNYYSSLATGVQSLATPAGSLQASLVTVEAGASLISGSAAGRRCLLPFGGSDFNFSVLAGNGKTIVQRSLQWASRAPKGPPAIAHWRLDESRGKVASDSSGVHHGAVYGGAMWTAGKLLNSQEFDGSNDYIEIPDDPALRPTSALTITAWIKGDAWSSGSNVDIILRKGNDNPNNWQFAVAGGKPRLFLDEGDGDGNSNGFPATSALSTGQWYHVAATWDGKTVRIYVDGAVANGSGGTKTAPIGTDDRPVYIGGRGSGSTGYDCFDGIIDDVRYFDRALSGAEIRVIMNEATAADANPTPQPMVVYNFIEQKPSPQLVAHWTLDDTGTGGGGMAAGDQVTLRDTARVESYRSSKGPFSAATKGKNAVVATNSTSSSRFGPSGAGPTLWGDAYCGIGGSPSSVIVSFEGSISGQRLALSNATVGGNVALTSMPTTQNAKSFNSSQTWSSDQTFSSLTLTSGAVITIDGARKVLCTSSLSMSGNAKFVVPAGSSLTLCVAGSVTVAGTATINDDTSDPRRVSIIAYNESGGSVTLSDSAVVCGMIRADDDLTIQNSAQFYGAALVRDDLTMKDNARVRLDQDMPDIGVASPPAYDELLINNGRIRGGAAGNASGAHSTTGTAIAFAGVDDCIDILHHDDYLLADGAIAFWFRVNSNTSTKQGLFSKNAANNGDGQVTLYVQSGKVSAALETASSSTTITSNTVTTGTTAWHHVVFTFGQGGMKLYVDGVLAAANSSVRSGLGNAITYTGNAKPIVLGASNETGSNASFLTGAMDDVRIYDYVLDEDQVANLYLGQAIGASKLAGAVVYDSSGFGSPLDLPIADTSKISWQPSGGLQLLSSQALVSLVDAIKLHQGATRTKQVTIEAHFAPSATTSATSSDTTIFGYGAASARNLGLDQQATRWIAAIKAGSTVNSVDAGNVLVPDTGEHLIISYDGENITRYRNGSWLDATPVTGDFGSWTLAKRLTVAGEQDGSRAWTGTLYRIAIYDRAFNKTQARNVFNGQLPGSGAASGAGAVRLIEMP